MKTITGKVYRLRKYCAGLVTKEKIKVRVYFDGPGSYGIACDAHIKGADISIEYDVVLSEIPLKVFCKADKTVE